MTKIKITIGDKVFYGVLRDTPTGSAIKMALSFQSSVNTWGDEIYFEVSAQASLEPEAQARVEVGDLAYWPSMPAFCIFFGPTPDSNDNTPVAASAVNVFGKLEAVDLELLRSINDGEIIKVESV